MLNKLFKVFQLTLTIKTLFLYKKEMEESTFELNNQDYIELNKLLKIENLVETGGEAKFLIKNKEVFLNGEVEIQVRKKLRKGDVVQFFDNTIKIV